MSFVELTARSAFTFLDGASTPEALAERAAALGMPALALTDRFDLGGAVRFTRACDRVGVRPILGGEVVCRVGGVGLREASTGSGELFAGLILLCRNREGWRALSSLITKARMSSPRGEPSLPLEALEKWSDGLVCLVRPAEVRRTLTSSPGAGGRTGSRSAAADRRQMAACTRAASPEDPGIDRLFSRLRSTFPGRLYLALEHHGLPEENRRCSIWLAYAGERGILWIPTNAPRYARPGDRIVHDVLTCLRYGTTLDEAGDRLLPNGEWYLKSERQMEARWCPGCRALGRTEEIAEMCDFHLSRLKPALPAFPVPGGRDAHEFLRGLVEEGARERYADRLDSEHRCKLKHELKVIGRLGLSGYFLIMWDIVRFANRRGILVQGRGSAANSAVCYCLGITAVDPIGLDLLFERFLSEERDEAPDIDLDIAHRDREEVLQYVYRTYGRDHAAMVCETITYRGRMAVRDAARVLGFSTAVADALSMEADLGEATDAARRLAEGGAARAGLDPARPRTRALIRVVAGLTELPRHRSIHVGGFVLSAEPVGEIVPVEAASMADRTVIQWDKDDLGLPGLVKFDLLGLGILTVLGDAIANVRRARGVTLELAKLTPDDPAVYDMICAADTVGLFQIESRAQMNTLPRVKPRCFYDLVIEVALIRPGPIQGEMVHPYLRRRRGAEPVTYLDPRLEPILKRTLGVPLFQEQGMKVAVALAGYTPAQADRLRRAMGFKRSKRAMEEVGKELAEGLRRNGVRPEVQAQIFKQLTAFANYGFPESHAASFALLVYASAYLKRYYAPEYFCAMLNAQPMGFYASSTLIYDAQRHGVEVRPVDLATSEWDGTLEKARLPAGGASLQAATRTQPSSEENGSRHGGARGDRSGPAVCPPEPREGRPPALRLGLRLVRGLGPKAREKLRQARESGPFTSVEDVVRRGGLGLTELRTLAEAGAFESLWPGRRQALWELLRQLRGNAGPLALRLPEERRRRLRSLSKAERVLADYRTLGLSAAGHPMEFLRQELERQGVLRASDLAGCPAGRKVQVAGIPICRQRPSTAKGVLFITLEDETGFANFVVLHDIQKRYHAVLIRSPVLLLEGEVEREDEVVNVLARKAVALIPRAGADSVRTRSFR